MFLRFRRSNRVKEREAPENVETGAGNGAVLARFFFAWPHAITTRKLASSHPTLLKKLGAREVHRAKRAARNGCVRDF
jgi:hypothetical protein